MTKGAAFDAPWNARLTVVLDEQQRPAVLVSRPPLIALSDRELTVGDDARPSPVASADRSPTAALARRAKRTRRRTLESCDGFSRRPLPGLLRALAGFSMLIVFLVVVAPLVFVAYWLAAMPIRTISRSARDLSLEIVDNHDPSRVESFPVQRIVREHRVAVTNFLIAAVTLILSVVLAIAFGD